MQLATYLASWGMYRGSSLLLQRSYAVHVPVVESLAAPEFSELWNTEVGANASDVALVPAILSAVDAVREAYLPWCAATDTLATKVILGTLACLPAVDRLFIDGFKSSGNKYSYLNALFVKRAIRFCTNCGNDLRAEQDRIENVSGIRYPLMKLVDMYFWQIGYEADAAAGSDVDLLDKIGREWVEG